MANVAKKDILGGDSVIETTKTTQPEPVKQSAPEAKTVTIDAKTYNSIIDRLSKLERGEANEELLDEPSEHFVSVRLVEGVPVTFVDKVFSKIDEFGKEILHITVRTAKGEEKVMKYHDFIFKSDKQMAKIKDRKQQKIVTKQGMVERKEVVGYRTVGTGLKVPVKVLSTIDTLIVEMPDGSMVELNESAAN